MGKYQVDKGKEVDSKSWKFYVIYECPLLSGLDYGSTYNKVLVSNFAYHERNWRLRFCAGKLASHELLSSLFSSLTLAK